MKRSRVKVEWSRVEKTRCGYEKDEEEEKKERKKRCETKGEYTKKKGVEERVGTRKQKRPFVILPWMLDCFGCLLSALQCSLSTLHEEEM